MTLPASLTALLALLPAGEALEFARLQEAIYTTRFTGLVTIDFRNGMPKQINLGQPVQLAICTGSSQKGLDSAKGSGSS